VVIATQSTRIRRILEQVLCRLPARDHLAVGGFVRWIRCERDWKTYAQGHMVDRRAAALLPLAKVKRTGGDPQAQLVLSLPVCRLFSDEALTGILAHAFAHAVRAARSGTGWWWIMQDQWKSEEQKADLLATRWGFASELRARTHERSRVVLPAIDERESRIVSSITGKGSTRP
jgi:hypothetical protein